MEVGSRSGLATSVLHFHSTVEALMKFAPALAAVHSCGIQGFQCFSWRLDQGLGLPPVWHIVTFAPALEAVRSCGFKGVQCFSWRLDQVWVGHQCVTLSQYAREHLQQYTVVAFKASSVSVGGWIKVWIGHQCVSLSLYAGGTDEICVGWRLGSRSGLAISVTHH